MACRQKSMRCGSCSPCWIGRLRDRCEMAKKAETDKNVLLAEYSEAGDAMRAYADTRWKLLGAVIPISGGILALSIQFPNLNLSMNLFGLFTACLFALIEYRTQL